eukprot:3125069-Amphidinium_carterae.1
MRALVKGCMKACPSWPLGQFQQVRQDRAKRKLLVPVTSAGQARGTKEVEQEVESASEASTVNDDEAFLKA